MVEELNIYRQSDSLIEFRTRKFNPLVKNVLLVSKLLLIVFDIYIYGHYTIVQHNKWCLLIICLATLTYLFLRYDYEDKLMVMSQFGIQVSSSGLFYFQNSVRFIPKHQVLDVIIQEVFIGVQIKMIMALMVAGEDNLMVVFRNTKPRLEPLKNIWYEARECFYGRKPETKNVPKIQVEEERTKGSM